jgi:UDP-N-acetylglucosamine 2-epimerase (non-hydrolysing)
VTSSPPKRVLVTYGTRPEAIKMAPVVAALRARPDRFRVTVCVTAQHRGLLDQVNALFRIVPDRDLDLMQPGQTPADVTARVLLAMTDVMKAERPDVVLVHGDTTTALATALAAFYLEVPVGHVEAGLRSGRLDAPFPEEMNRVVIDRIARHLWAPTRGAAENLVREGVSRARIRVTGNTAVDALRSARARLAAAPAKGGAPPAPPGRLVLVTAHRRESFGEPLRAAFRGIAALARRHPHVTFVYPVHPNPNVIGPAREILTAPNVSLIEPVDFGDLVALLDRAEVVLTDSGGIQEEAATLGKPLLVLREVTERPEIVAAGAGVLVGTDAARIEAEGHRLLSDPRARAAYRPRDLFGDGRASERIAADLAGEPVAEWAPEGTRA